MQEGGEVRWEGSNGSERRQGMNVSIRGIVCMRTPCSQWSEVFPLETSFPGGVSTWNHIGSFKRTLYCELTVSKVREHTITEPPFPNWPPFPNFFLQPQSLRYFPILNYGIFLVAVANICVIFLIFYMSKQLYTTLNTGSKMRDFTYYWTSRAFLATPAFPNFMIYSNVVRYVKSQVSEYSEIIRMSTRKYKF